MATGDNSKQLHDILKERREALGLTQQDIADNADITKANYIQIELGRAFPKWNKLQDISKVLKLKWIPKPTGK